MLSNAYFLAKFRFDTAENEPAKNLQNFRKMHFRKMHRAVAGKLRALALASALWLWTRNQASQPLRNLRRIPPSTSRRKLRHVEARGWGQEFLR